MYRVLNIYFLMLVLFSTSICFGQDLEKHEWKDRVLLILSSDSKSLNQQIKSLSKDIQGLEERKLVVYQILPKKYLKGIEETNWIPNSKFFEKMKRTNQANIPVITTMNNAASQEFSKNAKCGARLINHAKNSSIIENTL